MLRVSTEQPTPSRRSLRAVDSATRGPANREDDRTRRRRPTAHGLDIGQRRWYGVRTVSRGEGAANPDAAGYETTDLPTACGLASTDNGRLSLYSQSIEEVLAIAALTIERRANFDALPLPPARGVRAADAPEQLPDHDMLF
jgi:hypothetical protein